MPKWKLYNPEGMQDILIDRCYAKRDIENEIRDLFRKNGFMEIETPVVEFYDVFSNDEQLVNQEAMFKFVDEKGRILALRPDMTIPTARVIGTKLKDMNLPIKISYLGNCFKYDGIGSAKQREFTQAGIEIFAKNNPFYDAQIIKMAIKTLLKMGLEQFTIELGQVEFFKGLMEQTNFDEELIELIRTMIEAKDFFGVEELLGEKDIPANVKEHITNLSNYFGDKKMLLQLKESKLNTRSLKAIDNLLAILNILEEEGLEKYISVDLGMVKRLKYYTGMIFKGLTYGVGFPILSGGRYDSLCEKFGKSLSATGFSLEVDILLNILQRNENILPKSSFDTLVVFNQKGRNTAVIITNQLREQGLKVDLICDKVNKKYAIERNIPGVINILDDENIEILNIEENTNIKTTVSQLIGGDKK